MAASADGRWLITGGTDRTPRIWDAVSGSLVATLPVHPSWVAGCAVTNDGVAATSCRDGIVRLHRIDGKETFPPFIGHEGRVWDVAILPCGDVVSAGHDGTVRRWHPRRAADLAGWTEWRVDWPGGISDAIPLHAHGSVDELLVIARSPDAIGRMDSRGRWSLAPERADVRHDVRIDQHGHRFAAADADYTIFIQSLPGAEPSSFQSAPAAIATGKLAWSGTAGLLIGTRGGTVAHWDGFGQAFTVVDEIDANPDAVAVTLAGGPRAVVVADKLVRLYDLARDGHPRPLSGRTLVILPQTMGRGVAVAWAPDGASFVIGTNEGGVERFDATSGQSLGSFAKHSGPIRAVKWAPDGRTLVSADAGCVRLSDDRTTTVFDEFRPDWLIESMYLGPARGTSCSIVVAGNATSDGSEGDPGRIAMARVRSAAAGP